MSHYRFAEMAAGASTFERLQSGGRLPETIVPPGMFRRLGTFKAPRALRTIETGATANPEFWL